MADETLEWRLAELAETIRGWTRHDHSGVVGIYTATLEAWVEVLDDIRRAAQEGEQR